MNGKYNLTQNANELSKCDITKVASNRFTVLSSTYLQSRSSIP